MRGDRHTNCYRAPTCPPAVFNCFSLFEALPAGLLEALLVVVGFPTRPRPGYALLLCPDPPDNSRVRFSGPVPWCASLSIAIGGPTRHHALPACLVTVDNMAVCFD